VECGVLRVPRVKGIAVMVSLRIELWVVSEGMTSGGRKEKIENSKYKIDNRK